MSYSDANWLTTGQLSKRTGVNIETIRYYENIGMIPVPPRSSGGRRQFTTTHMKRLLFIRHSRKLGFKLEEIRELLRLVDGDNHTCEEVESVTESHIRDVKVKISDLEKIKRALERVTSRCAGGVVPECPIIEELFGDSEVHE
jgi:MerR family mercuric resistance operon transcriptional regulator